MAEVLPGNDSFIQFTARKQAGFFDWLICSFVP